MATTKKTAKKAPAPKGGTIDCRQWEAFHDFMPGRRPTLRVSGVCRTPTPGYRIRLVVAEPQGINPKILLLEKVVTPPKKPQPDVITTVEVRFSKRTRVEYTHVTILPDGKTIKVKRVV